MNNDNKSNRKEYFKELKKYISSNFENPKLWGPKIAEGLVELEKTQTEDHLKFEGLEKKVNQSSDEIVADVMEQIKKVYAKIGFNAFMEYVKTPQGQDAIKTIMESNQEVIKSELQKVLEEEKKKGKKGFLSRYIRFPKSHVFTAIGTEIALGAILVYAGFNFLMNKTDVGRYIGHIDKTEKIEAELYVPKKDAKGRIVSYEKESRIDKLQNRQNELEKNSISKKELETSQKNYYEIEIKPKIEAYEKKIGELEGTIEADKKNDEKIKAENENNIKELEKKLQDYEKKNQSFLKSIKKLNPLK